MTRLKNTTQRPTMPSWLCMPRLLAILLLAVTLSGCNLAQSGFNQLPRGPVTLYWSEPMTRVNGDLLGDGEIVAYEIRYKHKNDQRYTTLKIENPVTDSHYFPDIADPDNTTFQMAAIDKNGLYSSFVTAVR